MTKPKDARNTALLTVRVPRETLTAAMEYAKGRKTNLSKMVRAYLDILVNAT